jgi:bacillithiol biosynthesis cysteine-adding enzyme BshC
VADRIPQILEAYKTDRNTLCDVLKDMNGGCQAGELTTANIDLLRDPDCVAVVSGQQAGLFTGPLYTIYKALSAVKLTECLKGRGFKAVPVFWIATEDHDFLEVSKAYVADNNGDIVELKNEPKRCYENLPVGYVKTDESIEQTKQDLFEALPDSEFKSEVVELVNGSWKPGIHFGDAFAKMLAAITAKYGLILLCPLDERLKRLASPIYVEAIKRSDEIVKALQARSTELQEAGYHSQVLITDDYFPLFWQAQNNTRHALKQTKEGKFRVKDVDREFTREELAELAFQDPQRFSPSVVLRSVVQDYLLPTVAYFGGAAEIAYFAQSAEVYRLLDRPVTPIYHRASFSLVEPKHKKTLDKYDLKFADLFAGPDELVPMIVERFLNSEGAAVFDEVGANINTELDRLTEILMQVEPTLADGLEKRRKKVNYHISAMRRKFQSAQIRKDDSVRKRLYSAYSELFPHKHLQERTLNITEYLNRYGYYFVDWMYNSIDLDDKGHKILYL